MAQPAEFNTNTIDLLLDEIECPVARMRLFSEGIHLNTRLFMPDEVIGDRACIACGNCVDTCPVVRDKCRFVFTQNQRTSMALETMVGEECRRCYKCIMVCPQVDKSIKEYASAFRRGEKIVHLLTAAIILSLAMTGITLMHYTDYLPTMEVGILRWVHRILGATLLLMPVLYFLLDKRHMLRFLSKVFLWDRGDLNWLKDLIRHIRNNKKYPMPPRVQFNAGQKIWYIYIICIIFPVHGTTGIIQWIGLDYGYMSPIFIGKIMLIHMICALTTDMLLFIHLYLKYLRDWVILSVDIIKAFVTKRHLNYPLLYHSQLPTRRS